MHNFLETPIGPNENVLSILTGYHDNLKDREQKLQKVTLEMSQVQAQLDLLKDANSNAQSDYLQGNETYQILKSEESDLNLRKVKIEQALNDAIAEYSVTILEHGGSNYVELYD